MTPQPSFWPYVPVGSPAARALVNYISAHGGGGVQESMDLERFAIETEFSTEEIQAGFALLVVRGFARINGTEVLLLTPQVLEWEAEKRARDEAKAAKRAVKTALRGGRNSRAAIPDVVKAKVYARDNFTCQKCGATDSLTLDHIHPWSLGGPDTEENLRVLCRPCNSAKGARV